MVILSFMIVLAIGKIGIAGDGVRPADEPLVACEQGHGHFMLG